jgi:RNA recognition motif-containing protein
MFTNALRTLARVVIPARNIGSLAAYRTAVPKNVSFSVSRLFTTSQVAFNRSRENNLSTPNTTIFVANIPWSATEEDLSELFAEFGQVTGVRIHTDQGGRPRGIAHVDYADKASAVAAMDSALQEPIHMSGRDLRVDFAASPRTQQVNTEPCEKLYFSGFPGDESELGTLFKEFGESIVDIHLLRNPNTGTRTPAGFL